MPGRGLRRKRRVRVAVEPADDRADRQPVPDEPGEDFYNPGRRLRVDDKLLPRFPALRLWAVHVATHVPERECSAHKTPEEQALVTGPDVLPVHADGHLVDQCADLER